MRRSVIAAVLVLAGVMAPALTFAQTTSIVRGRVVDTDGSGLPGVVVSIRSTSQPSGNKQVVTDIEGNYRIPLLTPANDYYIRVDYPGFAPIEMGPLDLDPGKTTVADLTLRSDAETTETIVVEGRGSTVDTETTKTSTSFNSEFIEGLPIIGHNYQDILTLAPGVTDTDGDGNPNVHGSRDTGLQIRLDGGNITDPVTGTFGQNLNADIIEEMEIITSGASAEFGRADGGFANVITKSGGNDFEGKVGLFWRGRFLDGDGANNNDNNKFNNEFSNFNDFRPSLSLGGAIVRDKLWYFGSLQVLDTETPVNQVGANILIDSRGYNAFAKLTWQVDSYNKLAFQYSTDPLKRRGLGLALGTSPDSDYIFDQGGITPQIKWTSTISPQLLLEASVTHFVSGIAVTPISKYFRPTDVRTQVNGNTIQALYPCEVINCNPERGERSTFITDLITGTVSGPFNNKTDDSRISNAIRTDLSYNVEDFFGQHSIKSGIEFADEKFEDSPITNPLLIDVTQPFSPPPGGTGGQTGISDQIVGVQVLQTFDPLIVDQRASSLNSGFYLMDAWKPRPNLTVNVGMRIDREDIDTSGFDFFDPQTERRAAIGLWQSFCAEARNQDSSLAANTSSNCNTITPYDGLPPQNSGVGISLSSFRDSDGDGVNDIAPEIARLDLNGDGVIDSAGDEGLELFSDFTDFVDRQTRNFEIANTNLSPRMSISWDPWADGKTKVFGTWSRFYDRLFLATVTSEIGPDNVNFTFFPNQNQVILPGQNSLAASTVSITQVSRDLRTPHTDEYSVGFERELAPEWSMSVTYINRKGYDLLQDVDVNHLTCEQHGTALGVSPSVICGDGAFLETDKFGSVGFNAGIGEAVQGGNFAFDRTSSLPNGAPDLYTVNGGFNQILRIGNNNSSKFEAYELQITKRLHRNWQMQASYTWSKAFGQAEAFRSALGDDPETVDDEEGFLAFDQRHLLSFQAVTQLPRAITLGTVVQWASGTPYSVTQTVVDLDSTGNTIFRSFFPTEQRNDQRNTGQWRVDTRLEKAFTFKSVQASAFVNVQNLLNSDDLTINGYDLTPLNGISLNATRNFGRQFEIGAVFAF